jgi:hypothetical protein
MEGMSCEACCFYAQKFQSTSASPLLEIGF